VNAHTHTLADWLAMVCIAAAGYGAFSAPYFLLVDATRSDFDPRPALARLIESGRLDALLIAVGPLWVAVRETARDAAALIVLLTTRPKGAMA
jgi:hypothetical protein